ncbi:MAG: alpha,alpha-trehalose-phosphate synthase (UDP-forming), partial [Acidimicrobiia bacterium]
GHTVRALARPISIDVKSYVTAATSPRVEREIARLRKQFEGRRILLGVDRLDYTKGILERLRALQLLFERRPSLVREVAFIQIAVPSRDDVKEYRDLREEVEAEVGRINGRFTEPGHDVPVHYLYRAVPFHRLLGYYCAADVAVVTPLKDGMNLIAKEYIVCQSAAEGDGALVLSRFAGAASELEEAVICNPFDVEGLSNCIEEAIDMKKEERSDRLRTMSSRIQRHDVFAWGDELLTDIETSASL